MHCFYIDDSGPRDPDRDRGKDVGQDDWFALGGILIDEEDEDEAKQRIEDFRARWPRMGSSPLHSYDIRNKRGAFRWLADSSASDKAAFYEQIALLFSELPIFALACVIDRPGYNARYLKPYGERRWKLCRSAFSIAVERAAKFARSSGSRLRVYIERSDKVTEANFRTYYEAMREDGNPFDAARAAKYAPLGAEQMGETLYEFRVKTKESLLMQLADLALWPMCRGGYEPGNRSFRHLIECRKLLDCHCTPENGVQGVKYYCFENVAQR